MAYWMLNPVSGQTYLNFAVYIFFLVMGRIMKQILQYAHILSCFPIEL